MNATSRAILITVLATDATSSTAERKAILGLINGEPQSESAASQPMERLLVTQKLAAELLSASR